MNDKFNLYAARRVFASNKRIKGESNRRLLRTTITNETYDALERAVPTGPGQYASPVVEVGIRMILAAVGEIPTRDVARELFQICNENEVVRQNLVEFFLDLDTIN